MAIQATASKHRTLGAGLGWFSIGLGLAAITAPRVVARLIGTPDKPAVFRMVGIREIIGGIGLVAQPEAPIWRWMRVVGDVMDLAILRGSLRSGESDPRRLRTAIGAVAGVAAVDLAAGAAAARQRKQAGPGVLKAVITIDRPIEECYRAWLDLTVQQKIMTGIRSIRPTGERRSHWTLEGLRGKTIEWDAEYTEVAPNSRLSWRSLPGSDLEHAGSVVFEQAPGGRGTVVRTETRILGGTGAAAAKLLGKIKAEKDLHRFKQLLETGDIPRTEGQPAGRRGPVGKLLQKGEK